MYINEAEPSKIKERFEAVKDTVNIDPEVLESYNSSTDKDAVLSQLVNKGFTSEEALSEKLKNALSDATPEAPENSGKKPGGSSSGGGGGGSFSKAPAYIVSDEKEPQEEKPSEMAGEGFLDLNDVDWAKEAILLLAERGVVNGRSETVFDPHSYVKREEFVKMLVLALELEENSEELSFEDVSEDKWYYDSVSKAVKSEIVSGISESEFGTGRNITRQDMAVMIYRAALKAGIEVPVKKIVSFSDEESISDYALVAVTSLAKAQMINGMGDGTFSPDGLATRAQAAKMIYNLIKDY